jgi:hypothetical protein
MLSEIKPHVEGVTLYPERPISVTALFETGMGG